MLGFVRTKYAEKSQKWRGFGGIQGGGSSRELFY